MNAKRKKKSIAPDYANESQKQILDNQEAPNKTSQRKGEMLPK